MTDDARQTGPAVEAHFQLLMWLIPTVEKFPRTQKFLLGDRVQTTALDVLEYLIEATYTRDRKSHSDRANLGLVKETESLFAQNLNQLWQHNRHFAADLEGRSGSPL